MQIMQIDFRRLACMLLPPAMRGARIASLMVVLLHPLRRVHRDFALQRDTTLRKLSYNGQTCNLRRMLNDTFGYEDYSQGFKIIDVETVGEYLWCLDTTPRNDMQHVIAYNFSEIYPITWATITPYSSDTCMVLCPANLPEHGGTAGDARMRALVGKYAALYFNPTYAYY